MEKVVPDSPLPSHTPHAHFNYVVLDTEVVSDQMLSRLPPPSGCGLSWTLQVVPDTSSYLWTIIVTVCPPPSPLYTLSAFQLESSRILCLWDRAFSYDVSPLVHCCSIYACHQFPEQQGSPPGEEETSRRKKFPTLINFTSCDDIRLRSPLLPES